MRAPNAASIWVALFIFVHSTVLWGQSRAGDIRTLLGPGIIADEGEIQEQVRMTRQYTFEDEFVLWVRNLNYESPDEIGLSLINPFAAFDLGLITDVQSGLDVLDHTLRSRTLTRATNRSGISLEQSERPAIARVRKDIDGRAIPVGWGELRTFQDHRPSLVQLLQKGNLPTGVSGDHQDGQLDAIEAFQLLVLGEILHRHGILATRGLFAGTLKNKYRDLGNGYQSTANAGFSWRIHNLPRRAEFEALSEPHLRRDYFQQELKFLNWSHPLIGGDLNNLRSESKALVISIMNEAMLKDLWAFHGSYFRGLNRSPAIIDYGTFSFLHEPNPVTRWAGNTYAGEINANLQDNIPRISGLSARDVFQITLIYHRLLRFGFSREQILSHFRLIPLNHSMGELEVVLKVPPASIRNLLEDILSLESMTYIPNDPQVEGYTPDFSDPAYAQELLNRSLVNTRELGFQMVQKGTLNQPSLTRAEIDELIRDSLFSPMEPQELDRNIESLRDLIFKIHKTLATIFKDEIQRDHEGIRARNAAYPRGQNLPSRYELRQEIYKWLNHPEGNYTQDFIKYVTRFDPPQMRDALFKHYSQPTGHPFGLIDSKFSPPAKRCQALF